MGSLVAERTSKSKPLNVRMLIANHSNPVGSIQTLTRGVAHNTHKHDDIITSITASSTNRINEWCWIVSIAFIGTLAKTASVRGSHFLLGCVSYERRKEGNQFYFENGGGTQTGS